MPSIVQLNRKSRLRVAGLMSGTSVDGVDAAVVDIDAKGVTVLAFDTFAYPKAVRAEIFRLFDPETSRVDAICRLNFVIGEIFAEALVKLCRKGDVSIESIDLVGSHGQTIYHDPVGQPFRGRRVRSTLQIGEPSVIAERTGTTVVADFRPRDIAAGGQGAPLVPYADYALFADRKITRCVQNIGGIANLTFLPAGGSPEDVIAFDTGPGNMIIDRIVHLLTDGRTRFDAGGRLAARGRVDRTLLAELMGHPYFRRRPPKTTGREAFGVQFADELWRRHSGLDRHDLLATVTALTARSIAEAYRRFLPRQPDQVILCGGGARNGTLVGMVGDELAPARVVTTGDFGIDIDAKEAVSFAILAREAIRSRPNNVPSATGARHSTVLGKIVPG